MINKTIPGGCFPTIRGKLHSYITGKFTTNCPVMNLGTALCSNSCRPISSSRVTFGATTSLTCGGTVPGTNITVLRPVNALATCVPSRGLNSVVNSIAGHHNEILNVNTSRRGNVRRLATRIPVTRVNSFAAILHSIATNEKRCALSFTHCRRTPRPITSGMVTSHTTRGRRWATVKRQFLPDYNRSYSPLFTI